MSDDDTQRPLLEAIRAGLDERGWSQRELGEKVATAERQPAYPQSTVAAWLAGKSYLRPSRVFIIERVMGMRPGTLSKLEGYQPAGAAHVVTAEEALAADPDISPEQAGMLGAAIGEARRLTRERRAKRASR